VTRNLAPVLPAPYVLIPGDDPWDEAPRVRRKTHSLPIEYLGARVAEWFHHELETFFVWMAVLHGDGEWFYWTKYPGEIPPRVKRNYTRDVLEYLNREAHFDGGWIGGFTHEHWPHFYLMWKDSDGDIQLVIDSAATRTAWPEIQRWEPTDWAGHASQAYLQWAELQEPIQLIGGQTVKHAQGEQFTRANGKDTD